jgi:diguanylate cyclase (GGDEF)-like protein
MSLSISEKLSFFQKSKYIKQQNYLKYIAIHTAGLCGLIIHFSFIYLFYLIDILPMSLVNIMSALIWVMAIRENYYGNHSRAIYLGYFEIIIHAILAVSYLGLNSGFQFYIWPVIVLAIINPVASPRNAVISALFCTFVYAFLKTFYAGFTYTELSESTLTTICMINLCTAAGSLIIGTYNVRRLNEKQQDKLIYLANIDDLTGLYNRRYFNNHLQEYTKLAKRNNSVFCIALCDVDFFKRINDVYGHNIGDQTLKQISDFLQDNTRQTDIVCRWGGEEFIILFPDTTLDNALTVLDKIRVNLQSSINITESSLVALTDAAAINPLNCVTMSFGLVQSDKNIGDIQHMNDALVHQADQLLYQAKHDGRNCIKTLVTKHLK